MTDPNRICRRRGSMITSMPVCSRHIPLLCILLGLTTVQTMLWRTANTVSVAIEIDLSPGLPEEQKSHEAVINASLAKPTKNPEAIDTTGNSTSKAGVPFRILLGIFTYDKPKGAMQRDLIRRTYLALPTVMERHNVTTISLRHSRICSLQDYWQKRIVQPDECQLLYTFVIGGNKNVKAPLEYLAPVKPGQSLTINISDPEPDVVYLSIKENMDLGKTNTWFHYASKMLPPEITVIGKVDTDSLVFPNMVLKEMEKAISTPDTLVYGGSQIDNDRGHSYMQGGFYFLSRDIARRISTGREDRWTVVRGFWEKYRYQRPEDVETGQLVKAFGGPNVTWIDIPEDIAWVHRKQLKEEEGFLSWWDEYVVDLVASDRLSKLEKEYGRCPNGLSGRDKPFLDSIDLPKAKTRFSRLLGERLLICKETENGGKPYIAASRTRAMTK